MADSSLASAGLDWLAHVLDKVWPHTDAVFDKWIRPKVEEQLRQKLGTACSFDHCRLGPSRPALGPIEPVHHGHAAARGMLEFKVGVRYQADIELSLSVGPATAGINSVKIVGSAHVLLGPLLDAPPFVGAVRVFFANQPDIDLNFKGLLNIAHVPGLEGYVRSAIGAGIRRACVLPNRILKPLGDRGAVAAELNQRRICPVGALRVQMLRATELPGKDIRVFGARTSDPYVSVVLGEQSFQTPVVAKTTSPSWSGPEAEHYFLVHSLDQWVSFSVFDRDRLKSDDVLGSHKISVQHLLAGMDEATSEMHLPLVEDGQGNGGHLVVHAALLAPAAEGQQGQGDAAAAPPAAAADAADDGKALLEVHVHEVKGIEESKDAKPPYVLRVSTAGASDTSRASTAPKQAGVSMLQPALRPAVERMWTERGMRADAIADLLCIRAEDVQAHVALLGDSESVKKARHELNPQFHEMLHLVLSGKDCRVTLELLNKEQGVVGHMRVPVAKIRDAGEFGLPGPFIMGEPTGEALNGCLELHCHIRMKRLQPWQLGRQEPQPLGAGAKLAGESASAAFKVGPFGDDEAWQQFDAQLRDIAGLCAPAQGLLRSLEARLAENEAEYARRYPTRHSARGFVQRLSQHSERRKVRFVLVKRWRVLRSRCAAISSAVAFSTQPEVAALASRRCGSQVSVAPSDESGQSPAEDTGDAGKEGHVDC